MGFGSASEWVFPHITVWGSCFSLCTRRSSSSASRVPASRPFITHHSSHTIHHTPLTTHHTPFITHYSSHSIHHTLLITHHSSHTTHHTPLITHHSSHTIHHTPLITHHSSQTTHHTPFITHHSTHTTRHTPFIHSSHTTHHTPLITHHSSHTIHHTPLITHHSSHTTHHTPFITHHSSHTTHHRPLITHHSSHTTHHTPFIAHHSSHTTRHTPLITHHSSQTIHHTPLITHHSSHTTHHTPFITHHSSHTTRHTPLITHHSSQTIHHTPLDTHHSSHTTRHRPLITHHSSHTTQNTPLITHHSSHTTQNTPLITHHSSHTTHHAVLLRGRRSTESLLKELLRAWSPLGAAGPRAGFCVAGAVQRASWRSCCALGRRWAPLGRAVAFAWQVQYREPPEGAAARLVAAGRRSAARWLLRGKRSTESLLKELLRAWSPLGAAGPRAGFCVAGAVQRASWRSFCALGRRWAPLGHSSHTTHHTPFITHHSSHTTRHTPLITHHSSQTIHHTPLITHHSSHTTHHTPFITHHSSHTTRHTPLITHHSSQTIHHTPLDTHHSSHTTRHRPLITHHSSHTTQNTPLITHHSSHTTQNTPLITHHSSHTTHHAVLLRGRRSTESLLKELLRAWSPLGAAGPRAGFCVAGAVQRASWRSCCALGRRWAPLGRAVAFAWQVQYREPPEGAAARLVAAGRRSAARWLLRGKRSTESLLKELLRAWSPLGAAGPRAGFCVAGAVQRASWRSFCALGRRWALLGRSVAFVWQAQYREPPGGASARLVAAGRRWGAPCFCVAGAVQRASWRSCCALGRRWAPLGRSVAVVWQAQYREPPGGASARWLLRGRRSTESLLTELLRAWSPLGAAGPRGCFCVAGAVQRASWRSCCALGRRWAPLGRAVVFAWQAQYREPPEGAAARLVAAGRRWAVRWLLRGRRSIESLLKELLRAWSPLGAAGPCGGFCVAGAVQRASWTSFCALRRRWAQLGPPRFLCGRRSTESLLEELLRAWSPRGAAGPRFAAVWQAQYREPSGGAAARVVAAGPRFAAVWQAQYREPSGGAAARLVAAGRRWAPPRFCVAGAVQRAFWRSCCALGRRGPPLAFCVAGAAQRAFWRSCCALGRRWAPLRRASLLCGRRSTESLLEELLRGSHRTALAYMHTPLIVKPFITPTRHTFITYKTQYRSLIRYTLSTCSIHLLTCMHHTVARQTCMFSFFSSGLKIRGPPLVQHGDRLAAAWWFAACDGPQGVGCQWPLPLDSDDFEFWSNFCVSLPNHLICAGCFGIAEGEAIFVSAFQMIWFVLDVSG